MSFRLGSKSEWFVLDSPLGEPDIKWRENEYWIERIQRVDGEIVWFGQGTNWVKKSNEGWTKLGDADNFYPCEEPIYEKLYKELI